MVVFGLHRPDAKTGRQLFVTAFQAFDIFIVTSHKVFMAKHRSRWVSIAGFLFIASLLVCFSLRGTLCQSGKGHLLHIDFVSVLKNPVYQFFV